MTIMFCQECHQVSDCHVENPQPTHRSVYYEFPYINAYIRERTCTNCGGSFNTYEIGDATFSTLRKIAEMSQSTGNLINNTWAETREDFFEPLKEEPNKKIQEEYEKDLEKMSSLLPDNVVLFPKNKDE